MTTRTWPPTDWSLRIDGINPYDTNFLYHHQPIRELCTSWSHTCDSLPHFALKKRKRKKRPFLKSTGESGPFEPIWLLKWPCNKCNMFCSSAGEEPTCNVGDPGSIPGSWTSPEEVNSYPLQYFGPENSMDCIVHRYIPQSRIGLSDFHLHFPSPKLDVSRLTLHALVDSSL